MIEALSDPRLLEPFERFLPVLLRTSGLVAFCPIFSSVLLPVRFRMMLAVALAGVLMPLISAPPPFEGPATWVLYPAHELVIGLGLGIAARVIFDGVEGAARIIAAQSGFNLSNMIDPLTGSSSVAPALYQGLLMTALILAADLHHLFIRALLHSYELLPPGLSALATGDLEASVARLGGRLFGVAVQLAAPGLLATFAIDLVLVLVGRAIPSAPVLIVGYPLKVASGVIGMLLLTFATASALRWIGNTFTSDGTALLGALAAG